MAENVRYPTASPQNSGFSKSTDFQGIGGLPRADDFYETVLAMASHDLRQPLQLIISAQELLARRVAASPEREHLECSNAQAHNWLNSWTSWSTRYIFTRAPAESDPSRFPFSPFWGASRNSSTERRGGKASPSLVEKRRGDEPLGAARQYPAQSGAQRARSYVARWACPRLLPPARSDISH